MAAKGRRAAPLAAVRADRHLSRASRPLRRAAAAAPAAPIVPPSRALATPRVAVGLRNAPPGSAIEPLVPRRAHRIAASAPRELPSAPFGLQSDAVGMPSDPQISISASLVSTIASLGPSIGTLGASTEVDRCAERRSRPADCRRPSDESASRRAERPLLSLLWTLSPRPGRLSPFRAPLSPWVWRLSECPAPQMKIPTAAQAPLETQLPEGEPRSALGSRQSSRLATRKPTFAPRSSHQARPSSTRQRLSAGRR